MKKKPEAQVVAVAVADTHIREDRPVCRTDDYMEAQGEKWKQIQDILNRYEKVPLLIAGDVFDNWKPSPWLISWAFDALPDVPIIAIPGQHDLPGHSLEGLDKSGLGVLMAAGRVNVLEHGMRQKINCNMDVVGWGFGETPEYSDEANAHDIILAHELIICDNYNLKDVPKWAADFKTQLLIVGDNHESFCVPKAEYTTGEGWNSFFNGKNGFIHLASLGSLMRMSADQMNHKPRVLLIYEDGSVTIEYLEITPAEKCMTRDHIKVKDESADAKLEAIVERAQAAQGAAQSFKSRLKEIVTQAKVELNEQMKKELEEILHEIN